MALKVAFTLVLAAILCIGAVEGRKLREDAPYSTFGTITPFSAEGTGVRFNLDQEYASVDISAGVRVQPTVDFAENTFGLTADGGYGAGIGVGQDAAADSSLVFLPNGVVASGSAQGGDFADSAAATARLENYIVIG